jgi:hypothetical protein
MYIVSEPHPDDPRARTAIPAADPMTKAQAAMDDLKRRMDELEAQPLKVQYTVERAR